MISLQVEPYCHECNDFEAHVVKFYAGMGSLYNTTVRCENFERCAKIVKYIKEATKYDLQRKIDN